VWNRQESFLAAYAKIGKIGQAAAAAEIPPATVESWQYRDTHGIKKRMKEAHQRYIESVEQVMDERLLNPTGNRGSDVLLMFKLKAEAPEKYREEVKVLGAGGPLELLDRLREMAAKDLKERGALEAPAVEGEFKEVEEPSQGAAPQPPKGTKRADLLSRSETLTSRRRAYHTQLL
jgi:hypothetical protein